MSHTLHSYSAVPETNNACYYTRDPSRGACEALSQRHPSVTLEDLLRYRSSLGVSQKVCSGQDSFVNPACALSTKDSIHTSLLRGTPRSGAKPPICSHRTAPPRTQWRTHDAITMEPKPRPAAQGYRNPRFKSARLLMDGRWPLFCPLGSGS